MRFEIRLYSGEKDRHQFLHLFTWRRETSSDMVKIYWKLNEKKQKKQERYNA